MKKLNILLALFFLSLIVEAKSPNFLIIHLDDEKFAGQDYSGQIPTIKSLESKALSLDNFYSPSVDDVALEFLTGKYTVNIKNVPLLGDVEVDEPCVAKDLNQEGYLSAYIGKWRNSKEVVPSSLGFDMFFGILDSDLAWPYPWLMKEAKAGKLQESAIKNPNLALMLNSNIIEIPFDSKQIIDSFTKEAIDFISLSKKQDKPFFIYLNYASSYAFELALKMYYPNIDKNRIANHYVKVDSAIAKVLNCLEQKDILEDTMIIFISKSALNAESLVVKTAQNAYCDAFYKKSAFVYMPKLFKEAKRLDGIVASVDFAGFILDCAREGNGENSLLGYLLGEGACDDSPLLYYGFGKEMWAMRYGKFKIIPEKPQRKILRQLYDLENDPKEENNLAKEMSQIAQELLKKARQLDFQQPKVMTKQELARKETLEKQKQKAAQDAKKKLEKQAKEKPKSKRNKN